MTDTTILDELLKDHSNEKQLIAVRDDIEALTNQIQLGVDKMTEINIRIATTIETANNCPACGTAEKSAAAELPIKMAHAIINALGMESASIVKAEIIEALQG